MNDKIFKTIELENKQRLEICDESRKIGADAYGSDAIAAVDECAKLIG